MEGISDCFEDLADPRTGNAGRHDLIDILVIALCTVLCGGQYASDMALFAREKEAFLRQFLKLENGPPSHDTFSRVFRLLDPAQFRACFQRFMAQFSQACQGVVAIDGKVLRRSFDKASGKSPLHMVSAWGCDQRLVLAQIATDAKSNEITAVPQLLNMLSLKGTVVTVDALNCQPRSPGKSSSKAATTPWRSKAIRARSTPTSAPSSTILRRRPQRLIPLSMPITAASRPASPWFPPMSTGCRSNTNGQV